MAINFAIKLPGKKYCYDDVEFETQVYKNDFHLIYEIMWKIDCVCGEGKLRWWWWCENTNYKRTMEKL